MSLADELLADLEEAREEEDGLYRGGEGGESDGEPGESQAHGGLEDIPEEMEVDYSATESVTSIAKLRHSKPVSFWLYYLTFISKWIHISTFSLKRYTNLLQTSRLLTVC